MQVGSVERIIPASGLRPYLIDAVERGMRRTLDQLAAGNGHAQVDSLASIGRAL